MHAIIKRKIRPRSEYNIDPITGPDPLTAADLACFDWGSIYEAAQYYDELLANGRKRFEGSYAFTGQATLVSILEQILICCRSYQQEYGGKIFLNVDKPRASTFILTSKHLVPNTLTVDQKQVHQNANTYDVSFLDLEVPAVCDISSITASGSSATINTVQKNPCAPLDMIRVGGNSNPDLNLRYLVISASDYVISAAPFYPQTGSGTGGVVGYEQMRFQQRTPRLQHEQAAQAAGQVAGPGAAKKNFKKLSVELDFANCTFDQADRLLKYEMYRDLGLDQSPWQPPVQITLRAWADSVDANGQLLKSQKNGDRLTLDQSASWEFGDDYEIIERWLYPFQGAASQLQGSIQQQGLPSGSGALAMPADQDAGYIQLLLRSYREAPMTDVSDPAVQSYATVPNDDLWSGPGPVNSGYQVISDTLSATDAGSNVTVNYSGVVIRPGGHLDISYTDGAITNQPYSTRLLVFVDDPHLRGGNIALQATDNAGLLTGHVGRMFIDTITTPAHGGGGTGGDGDGGGGGLPPCYVVGSLIHTSEGVIRNNVLFDRWKGKSGIKLRTRAGLTAIKRLDWVRVDEIMRLRAYETDAVECSIFATFFEEKAQAYVPSRTLLIGASVEAVDRWHTLVEVERIARRTLVLFVELEGEDDADHQYAGGDVGYWHHNTVKT